MTLVAYYGLFWLTLCHPEEWSGFKVRQQLLKLRSFSRLLVLAIIYKYTYLS